MYTRSMRCFPTFHSMSKISRPSEPATRSAASRTFSSCILFQERYLAWLRQLAADHPTTPTASNQARQLVLVLPFERLPSFLSDRPSTAGTPGIDAPA